MSFCLIWVALCLCLASGLPADAQDDEIRFPLAYEVIAEVNFEHLNLTLSMEEWADEENQIHRIRKRSGVWDNYIFDYKEGELHHFNGLAVSFCDSTPLTNESHAYIFGLNVLNASANEGLFSPMGALKAFKRFNLTSAVPETVRSIDCTCQSGSGLIEEFGQEFTTRYCWSSSSWTIRGMQVPTPVLVEFTGPSSDNGTTIHIEIHYKHYFDSFTDKYEDIFQTPEGLYCAGRKFKILPTLPTYLNYQQETFAENPSVEWVNNGKVTYDKMLNLVRYEYRYGVRQPPFYPNGSMSVTHDFNSGVAYYQDMTLGNCTAQPIGMDLLAMDKKLANITGIPLAEIRSPAEILQLDGNFSYVGEKTLRGLPTQYYIGMKEFNFPWVHDQPLKATFGVHFLRPNVKEVSVGRAIDIQTNVPLQLVIQLYFDPGMSDEGFLYKETYNFFNYESTDNSDNLPGLSETPVWMYDVGQCYGSDEEKHIRLVFEGPNYNTFLSQESALFPGLALHEIRRAIGGRFSSIRLQRPELDYNDTHIYLTLTILPAPDPKYQFVQVDSRMFTHKFDNATDASSMGDCLNTCAMQANPPCQAVTFFNSTKLCMLYNKMISWNETTYNNETMLGIRTVPNQGPQLPIETVMKNIKDAVEKGEFKVNIPVPQNITGAKLYTAVEFIDDIYRKSRDEPDLYPIVGIHLEQFHQERGRQVVPTRELFGTMLVDECASQCLNDGSEKGCAAFTYKFKTGRCSLSSWKPDVDKDKVSNSSESILFTRNYVSRFVDEKGHRLTPVSQKGVVVLDAKACAKSCVDKQSDRTNVSQCRSFDLCTKNDSKGEQMICYLSTGHIDDAGTKLKVDPLCEHFSRSYTSDFTRRFDQKSISLSGYTTQFSISEIACAKFCVEKVGAECKGYHLCSSASKSACAIVNANQLENKQSSGDFSCTYYERVNFPDGSQYTTQLKEYIRTSEPSSGISAGLTAFLVILFFVLGGLFVFIIAFAVQKKVGKPNPVEDVRVYFSSKGGARVGPAS